MNNQLTFSNADATPKNVTVKTDLFSVPLIMAWYACYHEGDRYTVSFEGRNVPMDHNGEPTNWSKAQ